MMVLQVAEGPWTVALMMTLLVLLNPMVQVKATPGKYVWQGLQECYTVNGTQRYVERHVYNREEYARFDSHLGKFQAVTELGRPSVNHWNDRKDILEQKQGRVDTMCRHIYEQYEGFPPQRLVARPDVNVFLSKKRPLQHHNMLICHVTDFYPGDIRVRWFLNGKEETDGVVSTKVIRNGDWTYQILVVLEMIPQQGDVYTPMSVDFMDRPGGQPLVEVTRTKTQNLGAFHIYLPTLGPGLASWSPSDPVRLQDVRQGPGPSRQR
ncbi:HLA class II histocompatibility antigen, DP beta 1 chain [Tupaia chinensis]|uniref:HLA class II histocompatibility antigen, DP beta 1 chain n=1 Tax=Tupaia chinensis TaxID=246437 RepID=L8Y201_TUPCH|nr:HLA class II histocompatibility antigen, DP beta 1 chain [Tupaia chinensis]